MQSNKDPPASGNASVSATTTTNQNDTENVPKRSISSRFVQFFRSITVEPVVVCFVVGIYLMSLTDQNMYLDKACRVDRNYSDEVCNRLTERDNDGIEEEDRLTESTYNGIQFWTRPLSSWLSSCLVLFWGAWSDRSGLRKPCIVFPLLAQLAMSMTNLVSSSVFVRTPLAVPMFSNAIVDGLSGGPGTLLVGVYSYLTDITAPDDLSYRVGMTGWCLLIGNIFGTAISGVVVRYLGFLSVYFLAAALFAIALAYTVFYIDESTLKEKLRSEASGGTETPPAKKSLLRQFFDIDHVVQTFRVVARTDPQNPKRRPIVVLLLIIWIVWAGPTQGEGSLVYLFTRLQFKWTEVEFSAFLTVNSVTSLLGNTFVVQVMSNMWQASDAVLSIVGLLSKLLANCVYAASVVSWMFFCGSVAEILTSATAIGMRAMASKAVDANEVGKMNAILALIESAVPLIFTPLYVSVYDATRDYWANAFLVLSIVLLLPNLPAFIWMGRYMRKLPPRNDAEQNAETANEMTTDIQQQHVNKAFQLDDERLAAERVKTNAETTYL